MSFHNQTSARPPFLKAFPAYIFNLVILIISTQLISFVALENVHVILFIIPLFFWVIHMPSILPLWFIFLAGLLIDFSVDSVLGLHAFVFVLYDLILFRFRRIILPQPVSYHFIIFALSVVGFEVIRWVVMSAVKVQIMPVFPSLLGVVMNIVAFFPILLVLKALHRVVSNHGR